MAFLCTELVSSVRTETEVLDLNRVLGLNPGIPLNYVTLGKSHASSGFLICKAIIHLYEMLSSAQAFSYSMSFGDCVIYSISFTGLLKEANQIG